MRYEHYMAFRYLRGVQGNPEGRRFLRFITYISVGGVAIGVCALLLALSIVRGFGEEIERKITGFGAHIQVESYKDVPLAQADTLQRRLQEWPGIASVSPTILDFILLRSARGIDGAAIWGTPEPHPFVSGQITSGGFSYERDGEGRPGIVIGSDLARILAVSVGDRVTAFSMREPGAVESGDLLGRPRVRQFHVTGIYDTGLANFDELYAFTDTDVARNLLGYRPDQVSRFDLTVHDIGRATEMARNMEVELGFPTLVRSIYEVYRNLFAWVALQRNIIPLVIGVIIIVAAFNIIGTLLMVILEKTGEIGILLSMGTSAATVKKMFLWLGLIIGGIGTAIGSLLALVLALIQLRFDVIPLPQEAYYMSTAPIALNPFDFLIVGLMTVALCAGAAYIPARVASRIDPIRSIRFAT